MYISFTFLSFFLSFLVIVSLLQPHITQKYKKQNKKNLSSIILVWIHKFAIKVVNEPSYLWVIRIDFGKNFVYIVFLANKVKLNISLGPTIKWAELKHNSELKHKHRSLKYVC